MDSEILIENIDDIIKLVCTTFCVDAKSMVQEKKRMPRKVARYRTLAIHLASKYTPADDMRIAKRFGITESQVTNQKCAIHSTRKKYADINNFIDKFDSLPVKYNRMDHADDIFAAFIEEMLENEC